MTRGADTGILFRAADGTPGIEKINLTTGPMSITGSTRMQATTSETFVLGAALEAAVERALRRFLTKKEMSQAGFGAETTLGSRLAAFGPLLAEVKRRSLEGKRMVSLEEFRDMVAEVGEVLPCDRLQQ